MRTQYQDWYPCWYIAWPPWPLTTHCSCMTAVSAKVPGSGSGRVIQLFGHPSIKLSHSICFLAVCYLVLNFRIHISCSYIIGLPLFLSLPLTSQWHSMSPPAFFYQRRWSSMTPKTLRSQLCLHNGYSFLITKIRSCPLLDAIYLGTRLRQLYMNLWDISEELGWTLDILKRRYWILLIVSSSLSPWNGDLPLSL